MKFNKIVKSIILEQGRYEILKKTYTEPKKKGSKIKPARMSKEELDKIVLADPTTRSDGDEIKKAGKYTQWILKQFLNIEPNIDAEYGTPQFKREKEQKINMFFEDLYKTTEDLQKFDRFKGQLDTEFRDINNLTINSLFDAVKDFSLEKATTTKAERKQMEVHPGAKQVFDGAKWDVYKIEDYGDLGKEAACFYGGQNKETRWCTSAPGLNYFNTYIKQGPLYVIIDKTDEQKGEITGLPKRRYQFHFPSNQFMDANDRQIDLVAFLNNNEELKEIFKPEFMKGLSNSDGTEFFVEYPRDSSSKFIALYGFDEFFDTLPDNTERLDFINNQADIEIKIPSSIGRFNNMYALHLSGILKDLPKEVSNLSELMYLSLPDNPKLKTLPKEIANKKGNDYVMKNLFIINIKNAAPNFEFPKEIQEMIDKKGIKVIK